MNNCERCWDDIESIGYCDPCKEKVAEHKVNCEIAQRHGLDCYPDPRNRYVTDIDEDKTNYGKKSEEIWLMDKLWEVIVKLDKELQND